MKWSSKDIHCFLHFIVLATLVVKLYKITDRYSSAFQIKSLIYNDENDLQIKEFGSILETQ